MANLLSLTQVKALLGLSSDDSYDDQLTALLPVTTQWFEQYCGRGLCERSVVDEEYLFNRTVRLYLWSYPVTTLTSLKKEEQGVDLSQCRVDMPQGIIAGKNGVPRMDDVESIKVTYVGGYPQNAVPPDLAYAFALVCGGRAGVSTAATSSASGGSGAIKAIGLGGGALSVQFDTTVRAGGSEGTYDVTNVPVDVQSQASILAYYKRLRV